VLNAGHGQTLSVTFTPTDAVNYTTATASVTIDVAEGDAGDHVADAGGDHYGTALSATQLNATSPVAGTFVYTPASGRYSTRERPDAVGDLHADEPDELHDRDRECDDRRCEGDAGDTWVAPAGITYGTALSPMQLNATASVPGSFVYTPAAGAILPIGVGHVLSATFTPTDAVNFLPVTQTATIDVISAAPTIAPIGNVTTVSGTPAILQVTASDPNGNPVQYTATGLPVGASIDSVSGAITGTPSVAGHTPSPSRRRTRCCRSRARVRSRGPWSTFRPAVSFSSRRTPRPSPPRRRTRR
jgi:hypothetical protein